MVKQYIAERRYDDDEFEVGSPEQEPERYSEFLYRKRTDSGSYDLPPAVAPPSPAIGPMVGGAPPPPKVHLSAGAIEIHDKVTAKYWEDGSWYEAWVMGIETVEGKTLYRVRFIGYDNEELVEIHHIRAPPGANHRELFPGSDKKKKKKKKKKESSAGKSPPPLSLSRSNSVVRKGAPGAAAGLPTGRRADLKLSKSKSVPNQLGGMSGSTKTKFNSKKQNAKRKALLAKAVSDSKVKPNINLVVIGHVDAGKSTLLGHLLLKMGRVEKREMRRFEKQSAEQGKASFKYAWVMDSHEEERSRGITVDVGVTSVETKDRNITVLDAPGHKEFIPNMISGASQADAAILVVPAKIGEFETSFGLGGQTKEHAVLARSLGVKELILAINKLDLVDWNQRRFEEIKESVIGYLSSIGFKRNCVTVVPVSGLVGENLVARKEVDLTHWYSGPTLAEAINALSVPQYPEDKPLCMTLTDVFKSDISGLAVAGKIESGCVIPQDKVLVLPLGQVVTVKNVTEQGKSVPIGRCGHNVELSLRDVEEENWLSVGQILCDPSKPMPYVTEFKAQVIALDYKVPLLKGQHVMVYGLASNTPGYVHEILSQIDRKTGRVLRRRPRCLPKNSAGEIVIQVHNPVCLLPYRESPTLGRVSIRRGNETVVVGFVVKTKVASKDSQA